MGTKYELIKEKWRPQQESNLYLSLRRTALYPFNYGADVRNSNRISGSVSHIRKKPSGFICSKAELGKSSNKKSSVHAEDFLFYGGAVAAPSHQLIEELSSKKNRAASDDRHNGGHSDDLCFIFLLSFSFFHFLPS